jgi:hypothetical protein
MELVDFPGSSFGTHPCTHDRHDHSFFVVIITEYKFLHSSARMTGRVHESFFHYAIYMRLVYDSYRADEP